MSWALVGNGNPVSSGNVYSGHVYLQQPQASATRIDGKGGLGNSGIAINGGTAADNQILASSNNVTTAWTGSWTLALRTGTGGVPSGGTFKWSWKVYKIAGQ